MEAKVMQHWPYAYGFFSALDCAERLMENLVSMPICMMTSGSSRRERADSQGNITRKRITPG